MQRVLYLNFSNQIQLKFNFIYKYRQKFLTNVTILIALLTILIKPTSSNAQVTCNSSGTWSATAGWVPAAPAAGENVVVAVGCTLYVDILTPQINNLTVNGVVIITNSASSILFMEGNLVINSGASVINDGKLEFITPGNNFNLNGTATFIHNPLDNISGDESIFTNSDENFSTTSNLIIQKWSDGNIPLSGPLRIATSIMGNVVLAASVAGGIWDQDGYFSVPTINRIRGSLTVSSSTIVMDDGTGSTNSLLLQDVTVNGTGNIVFQRGYNRNYSLQVNNFTVNSVPPAKPTVILDTCFGVLNMTVNGSMNIAHDFNAIFGSNFQTGADIRITVNGNLNISGGQVIFNNKASAPLLLNVTGTSTLNNSSPGGVVSFVEGGNGFFTFNTQDLVISGGSSNYLYGRPGVIPAVKGAATINVSNDFSVNGTSTTYIAYSDTNVSKVRVSVARDFTLNGNNASLVGAYTNGAFTFKTNRNFTQTNGQFTGQAFRPNISIDSIITGGNFVFNSGNANDFFKGNKSAGNTFIITTGSFSVLASGTGYGQGYSGVDSSSATLTFSVSQNFIQNGGQFSGILSGSGTIAFTIAGVLDVNGGVCKIQNNSIYSNAGSINFNVGSIDYDGGVFSAFYSCNNNGLIGSFNIGTTCDINFTNAGDEFSFIGLSLIGLDVNNLQLNLIVPGGITIGGVNGTFFSSNALGAEFITISSLTISNGVNSFNGQPGATGTVGHYVSLTVNGNVIISGGDTYLSAMSQSIVANIFGDLLISNGSLSVKGSTTTNSTLNIRGAYNHTGGNFYLHNHLTEKMPEGAAITVNVNSDDDINGNFTHTAGSIIFDNCSTTPNSMNLTLSVKSPNYTLGGTGQITMTNPGTGLMHGILSFTRNGVINFNRSGSHDIQQVKQNILGNCTVLIQSGNMQLASHNTAAIPPDALWIYSGGILDMQTNKIFSNATRLNSGLSVFGRVRTQNVNGMYDGTTNAAFSTNLTDNLDFYIATSSTIEYYGFDNQVITGLGVGKALLPQHKYGNLEINFGGTPDIEFVYPSNIPHDSVVMVRGNLELTSGELNLDNDHDPTNGGGRWIVVENTSVSAISRVTGYIRSESENGNGRVKWIFNSVTGNHRIPFGYNSTNYIPFEFSHTAGSSAIISVATYHSDPANLPYPPTVTHVNNNSGADNSSNTVDRFWYLKTSGTISSANLLFNCTPAETGSISTLVAQRWVPANLGWTNPAPGVQTGLSNGVQANGITTFNNWWTLSGNSVLLPVELISFQGECLENGTLLHWQTATEINNDFFSVQRSLDGILWKDAGIIHGAGNSSQLLNYSFIDDYVNTNTVYYRLQQTDFDGTTAFSDVIKIRSCKEWHNMITELASLSNGNHALLVDSKTQSELSLHLFSINGKLIETGTVTVAKGSNSVPVNSAGLSSGLYILRVTSSTEEFFFKLYK